MLGFDWMERNLLKSWVLKWLNNEHGDGKSETRIWKEVYSTCSVFQNAKVFISWIFRKVYDVFQFSSWLRLVLFQLFSFFWDIQCCTGSNPYNYLYWEQIKSKVSSEAEGSCYCCVPDTRVWVSIVLLSNISNKTTLSAYKHAVLFFLQTIWSCKLQT